MSPKTHEYREPVTNEDIVRAFDDRIIGLKETLSELIREKSDNCQKLCVLKIEHINNNASAAHKRIDEMLDAIETMETFMQQGEGFRKAVVWVGSIMGALITIGFFIIAYLEYSSR